MLKQKWREEGRSGVPRRDGGIKVLLGNRDECYIVSCLPRGV